MRDTIGFKAALVPALTAGLLFAGFTAPADGAHHVYDEPSLRRSQSPLAMTVDKAEKAALIEWADKCPTVNITIPKV